MNGTLADVHGNDGYGGVVVVADVVVVVVMGDRAVDAGDPENNRGCNIANCAVFNCMFWNDWQPEWNQGGGEQKQMIDENWTIKQLK